MNFRITLAWDGTDYTGWQMQPGSRTVQGVLTDALVKLEQGPVRVFGAGRTDAGVHAEGQVASFNLDRVSDPRLVLNALNGSLPPDLRVLDAAIAPDTFHARRDARLKTYRYQIFTGAIMPPVLIRYAWHFPYPLNIEVLAEDAKQFLGTHDFSGFTVSSAEVQTRTRTITEASVTQDGEILFLTFTGNGFLRYMVRTMVSALVDVNRGRLKVRSIAEIVAARDRHLVGGMAPAKGLTMVRVEY
jgi:tRNA pseudouridine38-40 synthase